MRAQILKSIQLTLDRRQPRQSRRGSVLVLSALLMAFLIGMIAFSVDLGYMAKVQTDLDRAVDSAVLAGVGTLVEGQANAEDQVFEFLAYNPVGKQVVVDQSNLATLKAWYQSLEGQQVTDSDGNLVKQLDLKLGEWNPATGNVDPSQTPSTVALKLFHDQHPFFFGKIFGKSVFQVSSQAVAMYQPRDIVVVLDYSGSMNDDSELKSINAPGLSRQIVEDNLFQIYTELGSPTFGNGTLQWAPQAVSSSDTGDIIEELGLDTVPYPYPSGSWSDWVNYVKSSNKQPAKAGYQSKFGYLTLVNYWLDRKPKHSQTPDLWMTSEQPIKALKDSVSVFLDYMDDIDTNDRIGLAVYNSSSGNGKLETGLTDNYTVIDTISQQRQAGHYHTYTNIGGGMETARAELKKQSEGGNGRDGALRLMVLMTDGKANWNNGGYNTSAARQHVLNEANAAKADGIQIVTISLGSGADTALMDDVAQITGGHHFNIPGGQPASAYGPALMQVFEQIAKARPLKLVQ